MIKLGYIVEANKLSEYSDFTLETIDASIDALEKKVKVKKKKQTKENQEKEEENTNEQKDKAIQSLKRA